MQPNQPEDQWRQPNEQPSGAPYVPPSETPSPEPSNTPGPVVTMAPGTAPDTTMPGTVVESAETQPVSSEAAPATAPEMTPVRWEATEYIHRDKNATWFVVFAVVVVALMAVAIFVMKTWSFAILIPVMAAALIVYSRRPPRVLNYTLSRQGLHVNDKLYPLNQFKAFSLIHGDDEHSIMLIPVKRLYPGVTIYFPEDAGEAIVDLLAARLPMQEAHLDVIDRIIRKLRL